MPESEVGDELAIPLDIRPLQVLEKTTALPDHLEEAAPAVVVLRVRVEVGPEVVDAGREERDLDGSASTIVLVEPVLLDDFVFLNRHDRRLASARVSRCKGSDVFVAKKLS